MLAYQYLLQDRLPCLQLPPFPPNTQPPPQPPSPPPLPANLPPSPTHGGGKHGLPSPQPFPLSPPSLTCSLPGYQLCGFGEAGFGAEYYSMSEVGYSRTKTAVCCGGHLPVCVQIVTEDIHNNGDNESISTYYTCCAQGADCCPANAQRETDPLGRTRCWIVPHHGGGFDYSYDYVYQQVGGRPHPVKERGTDYGGWYTYFG